MATYIFGVRQGSIPRGWMQTKLRQIAAAEDCDFIVVEGWSWFATRRDQLDPLDHDTAKRVLAAIKAAGINHYGEKA